MKNFSKQMLTDKVFHATGLKVVNSLNMIMLQKDDTHRHANRLKNEYKDVIHSITLQKETLIREIKEFILESREYVQNW